MKQRKTSERSIVSGPVPPTPKKAGYQQPVQQRTNSHRIVVIRDGKLIARKSGR
jgi:hypothetical protein